MGASARSPADIAAVVVRPEIRALKPYAVAKAHGMIKLDAMESPFGLPPALRGAIAAAAAAAPINRYPDGGGEAVRDALRDAFDIPARFGVLLGNGSDELIQIVTSALARPGAVMLAPEPSFVMYARNALYTGMRYVGVALRQDFSLDVDAMLATIEREQPSLLYIAYPNNPTGNLFDAADVERIVRAMPGLAVVDEAYYAFAGATFVGRLDDLPNLLVLRTVSKIGMAGLRLGYAIADPAWITELDKVRQPYNLNALTQAVAPVMLRERETIATWAATLKSERERLEAALVRIAGVAVHPTRTNFVLVRVPDAARWYDGLARAGLLVKNLHGWHPLLANCLRITVGSPAENDTLLNALEAIR